MTFKATELPSMPAPVSAKELVQENEARLNHASNMAQAKGGGNRRRSLRRRRRGGANTVIHDTGNPQSDANALASANMIKQMDQINAAQTKGGMRRRKKRHFKTRKYIKVGYVRKRR